MKKMLYLLLFLCISLQSSFAYEFDKSNHPKHLGANNWGMEFYFTFLPCLEKTGSKLMQKVYITSNVRTKVKLSVEATKYEEIQYTIPNDIIEFSIKPTACMPFRMKEGEKPQPEYIESNFAINIVSDDPIICYALTDNVTEKQSEGFLVYPLHTLGKDYVNASYYGTYKYWWGKFIEYPAYISIVAPYDSTEIQFTMGGNEWSITAGGQKPGEKTKWNLNKGDVLLISSLTYHSELSNSIILSNKRIAVISGNYCASLDEWTNDTYSEGLLQEMEMPTESFGFQNLYYQIKHKSNTCWYDAFGFKKDTKIKYDNGGFSWRLIDAGTPQSNIFPAVSKTISCLTGSNKFTLTCFNIGYKNTTTEVDPFQMVMLPVEQYQYEMTLMTPGNRGEKRYADNYLNICFSTDKSGKIPNDLQIGIFNYKSNKYVWSRLNETLATQAQLFTTPSTENFYAATTIKLPTEGVFKLRADKPFQAYSYGFSANDGYGFPSSASLKKLGKIDNQPPVPEWTKDCNGNVNSNKNTFVIDIPNDTTNRSNLALIYMHSDVSFNYQFNLSNFFPCDSSRAEWNLNILDSTKDALAVITFADCYGNDTTLVIEHYHRITTASDSVLNNQNIVLGNDYWKQITIKNTSINSWYCDDYKFKNNQIFSLWNIEKTETLTKQFKVNPNDSIQFWVKCDGKKEGDFIDSLGFLNNCEFSYDIALNTKVGIPILEVSDLNFHPSNINDTIKANFNIRNLGSVNLEITKIKAPTLRGTSKKKIFMLNGIDFEKISKMNPLVLTAGGELELTIEFSPDDTIYFSDSIVFNSNSFKQDSKGNIADSICRISGKGGINIIVRDPKYSEIKLYPNPTEDILMIKYLPEATTTLQIFDESGKTVKEMKITNPSEIQKISTKEFSSGNYIFRILIGKEFVDFKVMVVR